jgi:tRNA1(Val) A37 N6-methylase TrmN6
MNFEDAFPSVMKRGGFDAVVGNPPYVRQEGISDKKEYFKKRYTVYNSIADLYVYFIEKAFTILRPNGLFGYIVANKWIRANFAVELRSWLKKQNIKRIIDFGDLPVFKNVTT